jgi:hypothetical protein
MSDILVDNKFFYNLSYYFIHYFGILTKIITILFIIGFFTNKPSIFLSINFIVKVCISLFLIYRFNKYRKNKVIFTELDRKICYSAGIYILFVSFLDVIQSYTDQIRILIQPYTLPVIEKIKKKYNSL